MPSSSGTGGSALRDSHCGADVPHIRQSRPDSDQNMQVKVCKGTSVVAREHEPQLNWCQRLIPACFGQNLALTVLYVLLSPDNSSWLGSGQREEGRQGLSNDYLAEMWSGSEEGW